jgi:phospholipase/carboxylesterase
MKLIESTLFHRILPPGKPSGEIHPTLLMVHGRGADEEDLLGLSSWYDPRLMILSVRAPFQFSAGGGYTWYDVGEVGAPEPAMFRSSYDKLAQFVDDALAQYPVDRKRFFLLGFSMGTVMSYALSLTKPQLFRGVLAHSGYVPEGTSLTFRWQDLAHLSYFIAHGSMDPVIPVGFARHAHELFAASNAPVVYKEYPMGHEINEESLADATAFLGGILGSKER